MKYLISQNLLLLQIVVLGSGRVQLLLVGVCGGGESVLRSTGDEFGLLGWHQVGNKFLVQGSHIFERTGFIHCVRLVRVNLINALHILVGAPHALALQIA